jgi:NhaP-type Na+/H+ or K+/H+ antiporter
MYREIGAFLLGLAIGMVAVWPLAWSKAQRWYEGKLRETRR